jgi:hypothetical protein
MAWPTRIRTEHGGAKGSSAKEGYRGVRVEAKLASRKRRRLDDKRVVEEGRRAE